MQRQNDLIFDIGVHSGEDTAFYLKKGFRVVGVEANPELCKQLRRTFFREIGQNRLTLVEAAIATARGRGKFYKFDKSVWGTISPEWADRNKQMGLACEEVDVEFITPHDLYKHHGIPYFMKIDIEGADMLCVEALADFPRPKFISMEAEKHDFERFEREIRLISDLGYGDFQLVQQQTVPFQRTVSPPREGLEVRHRFAFGSSGLFGNDLPERGWLDLDSTLLRYRRIVKRHNRFGDYGLGRRRISRNLLRAAGLYPGWHDLHARLKG